MITPNKAAFFALLLLSCFGMGYAVGHDDQADKVSHLETKLKMAETDKRLLQSEVDSLTKGNEIMHTLLIGAQKARDKRAATNKRIDHAKQDQAVDRYLSERIPDELRQAVLGEKPGVPVP